MPGRRGRWTFKQERDVERLWDAAVPIILGHLHNPQISDGKKLDTSLEIMRKFGIVRPPEAVPATGPAPKFIFHLSTGLTQELDTATLLRGTSDVLTGRGSAGTHAADAA